MEKIMDSHAGVRYNTEIFHVIFTVSPIGNILRNYNKISKLRYGH